MEEKIITDIDQAAAVEESRGVRYKIRKSKGNKTALYVQITPGSGGGVFGHALHLKVKNDLVYAKFLPFADAINKGNSFVASREYKVQYEEGPADEECEQSPEEDERAERLESFEQGNIRTVVRRNKPGINLFNVNVYVDNYYVIQLFKDCNFCKMFDYTTAVQRAKEYLPMLQGWKR
ncbi:MAG: hypothetical protein PVH88_04845 [Ignavibacteria bacterium]|jgi:hypothetical protein